jgi:hypothetical protein
MSYRSLLVVLCACVLGGCPQKKDGGGFGIDTGRCEVDLDETGLFARVGTGARALQIDQTGQLIGGPYAQGRVGDYLLENDRIRVVVNAPGRHFAPAPFGGWIIDADLQRPAGTAGRDNFGRMALFYAFGRTVQTEKVEVLRTGEQGGPAVLAATGRDALNDVLDLQAQFTRLLPGVRLVVDPEQPLPLRITTYYVLSPGESRVRVLTAFCNQGSEGISIPIAEVVDRGGDTQFFNPEGCTGLMGAEGCLIDPSRGFGLQGEQVAYGYRTYRFDTGASVNQDALINIGGLVGVLAAAENQQGVLSWVDSQATRRPGTFGLRGGEQRTFLRDFFVTSDLGELTTTWLGLDAVPRGRLVVTVKRPDGTPAPGARVAVTGGDGRLQTLMVADGSGRARADLPAGTWRMWAGLRGHAIEAPIEVPIATNGTTERDLALGASRTLSIQVSEPSGAPSPAKVTVLCPSGVCPTPAAAYGRFEEAEKFPTHVAAVAFVGPQGGLELSLAPGAYHVVVTRGPEYSVWPSSWPLAGEPVDLTLADASISAVLAKVVDTTGWMSADLHVHGVNSTDSSVPHEERVLSFLAEGVDVLVSTDHDALTDYGPTVRALGAEAFMATMVGSEVTPFTFGHYNAFPMILRDEPNGGPFDWAGGDGPTLRTSELFAGLRQEHPEAVIQINHPRRTNGTLSNLEVDTDTFASHAEPSVFRMAPSPNATAGDTDLFGDGFDAIEVANGLTAALPVMNDWMTMLSSGRRKVGTASSDTHLTYQALGGYSRTLVDMDGRDAPAQFDAQIFARNLRAQKAVGTNAPFVRVSARALDAAGTAVGEPVGLGDTVSIDAAGGQKVELTIEVQTPEWIRFDTLEVFTHEDGREALGGVPNSTWHEPVARITLDATALPVEPVSFPGAPGGHNFNRIRVEQKVVLEPTFDTWYVVVVRSASGAVGTLYPLAYAGVSCSGNLCSANAAKAYAFTNPIYVDADASGAYDTFPQKFPRTLRIKPPQALPPAAPRVPTAEEVEEFLRELVEHSHAH